MQEANDKSLVMAPSKAVGTVEMPRLIAAAGPAAQFAWEEFFVGKIRNAYTRRAYLHAMRSFLKWIEARQIELVRMTPGMVGQYLDELPVSIPTKKLYLAGIRSFLDVLVQRHVIVLNPAHSVRAPRYSSLEGKTPEITVQQCRTLLASIRLNTAVDYRDRAIIAVLIYTAARAGAVGRLRIRDLQQDGIQLAIRFAEKGGKSRLIPVRSNLEVFIREYLSIADLAASNKDEPLFRTGDGRSGRLTASAASAIDICRMVKRRLKRAGIETNASPHSFRACTATDLLLHGTALEDVQHLLGHSDSRVTAIYDRRRKQVTRNIVERISV
jgi:site-specific recombinase XerD